MRLGGSAPSLSLPKLMRSDMMQYGVLGFAAADRSPGGLESDRAGVIRSADAGREKTKKTKAAARDAAFVFFVVLDWQEMRCAQVIPREMRG